MKHFRFLLWLSFVGVLILALFNARRRRPFLTEGLEGNSAAKGHKGASADSVAKGHKGASADSGAKAKSFKVFTLGDSSLNNSIYVPMAESIPHLLQKQFGATTLATDGAEIRDVYRQLKDVPSKNSLAGAALKQKKVLLLSVGGNDILNRTSKPMTDLTAAYQQLVAHIKEDVLDPTKGDQLILQDVYFPADPAYRMYDKDIKGWNKMVAEEADATKTVLLLKASTLLGNPKDFVYDIEPSGIGGASLSKAYAQLFQESITS
jgi:hypothetical protein